MFPCSLNHHHTHLLNDIEEGFRDLKTLFGFKHLVLKKPTQARVEILLLLVIISMLFLLYEKSGYRWSRYYNTSCRKDFRYWKPKVLSYL